MPSHPKDNETNLALDVAEPVTGAKSTKRPRKTQNAPPDTEGTASAGRDPKLPHERDESVGVTGGEPSADMQQAHRDVQKGLQDTGRGPEADRAYQKLKR